jgi:hypothetical protein
MAGDALPLRERRPGWELGRIDMNCFGLLKNEKKFNARSVPDELHHS